jgi:hypothetical protein
MLSEAEIAEATRFRTEVGLRADRAWVIAVAADPRASADAYGVSLLPAEVAELDARASIADAVAPVICVYAAEHAATYAGLFIDHAAAGRVVALFTGDPEPHRAALLRLLRPGAAWEVRTADLSLAVLEALERRLQAARAESEAMGIRLTSVSVDVVTNRVLVGIASEDPEAPVILAELVTAGEMLRTYWDTDFISALPRGSLRGRAVDAAGHGVGGLFLSVYGDIGRAEPDDAVGHITAEDGTFSYDEDLAAMGWRIELLFDGPEQGDLAVVGSAHVVVVGGQETYVEILVTLPG